MKPFIPSSWHLMQQIKAAEAKCMADIECQREEFAEGAFAINARKIREEREYNCRRYVYVGQKP